MASETGSKAYELRQRVGDASKEFLDANRKLFEAIAAYHEANPRGDVTAGATLAVEEAEKHLMLLEAIVSDILREAGEYDA